jgi:MFS family permease
VDQIEIKRFYLLFIAMLDTVKLSPHTVQRLNNPFPPKVTAHGITSDAADRASLNAALTLALTLPGDTLLYLLLPLYAASFGVTLPEAGALLAANRLVRIAGYGWIARFYADRGPRTACLLAAFGAILATLSYAALSGIWLLLIGRLMWGISFAAMNIANQALPTAVLEGAAVRAGRARAIIAVGPTVGLLAGAVLALYFGPRSVFMVLTLIACLAPWFALRIPKQREPAARPGPRFERPGPISLWAFSMGFTLDGLFMFGLGLLAASSYPKGAVLAAGVAMSLRYATEVVFSTAGGSIAERFGARRVLVTMSLMTAFALTLLAGTGPWLWSGVVATIVLRALTQPLAAPLVAEAYPGSARVPALARQATWRDIGAGTGPLAAGLLFPIAPASAIYGGAAVLLAGASVLLLRSAATGTLAAGPYPSAQILYDGGAASAAANKDTHPR